MLQTKVNMILCQFRDFDEHGFCKSSKSWTMLSGCLSEVAPSGLRQFLALTALKNDKEMLFILPLFSRYLNFCLDFLVMLENGLIRKIMLISEFMTSQPGKLIIAMCILPNISGSTGNQTMKFGQLIEYNMKNIFF